MGRLIEIKTQASGSTRHRDQGRLKQQRERDEHSHFVIAGRPHRLHIRAKARQRQAAPGRTTNHARPSADKLQPCASRSDRPRTIDTIMTSLSPARAHLATVLVIHPEARRARRELRARSHVGMADWFGTSRRAPARQCRVTAPSVPPRTRSDRHHPKPTSACR